MRRRTPLSLVLCATLLFAAVSTVCAEPDSGGDSWTWSAKSAEENVGKNAGGSSDPAPAEAIPRKSGGFSFPGPQASEKKNKDGIRTIPLNPVSPGIPLVDETTSPSRAKKSQGISPKDVIATVANLQDEDNGITNTNKQINPRRGKSITKALGDPAVNVEARFGKKICKYTGFCKSKSVHPSEVVYVQPVKIQAVGDEIPAIIGTKKGGLHLGGGGLHLGGGGFSSYGPPPVPYYPPSPVQHHHDHHHHHKHKGKKFGYGGGFQAGGFSSSSGGGWAAGPHGVPYARDDNTYYDSVETSGGARVQGGGAQTLNTQLDLSGITGGGASGAGGQQGYAGAPSYSGGPSYASAPAAGPAPAGFSKRGPRQQQYNGGASGKKRRQQAGPAQAAINPQAFQVQAQVAQAQLAQLQQQQFSQYPPQQQPYPVPQQNFASSYPAPLPNVAQNYPPQPAYNPAAFQQPPYIPQPQFQQPPAYLPPSAKSNDCVCVPASSCAPQDVLGRENRPSYQYNQLDPRNKKKPSAESSDSYSELADSLSEDVASYYGDNEARNSKSDAIAALTDAEIKELEKAPAAESRRKRDAPSEQSSDIAVPDLTPAVPESFRFKRSPQQTASVEIPASSRIKGGGKGEGGGSGNRAENEIVPSFGVSLFTRPYNTQADGRPLSILPQLALSVDVADGETVFRPRLEFNVLPGFLPGHSQDFGISELLDGRYGTHHSNAYNHVPHPGGPYYHQKPHYGYPRHGYGSYGHHPYRPPHNHHRPVHNFPPGPVVHHDHHHSHLHEGDDFDDYEEPPVQIVHVPEHREKGPHFHQHYHLLNGNYAPLVPLNYANQYQQYQQHPPSNLPPPPPQYPVQYPSDLSSQVKGTAIGLAPLPLGSSDGANNDLQKQLQAIQQLQELNKLQQLQLALQNQQQAQQANVLSANQAQVQTFNQNLYAPAAIPINIPVTAHLGENGGLREVSLGRKAGLESRSLPDSETKPAGGRVFFPDEIEKNQKRRFSRSSRRLNRKKRSPNQKAKFGDIGVLLSIRRPKRSPQRYDDAVVIEDPAQRPSRPISGGIDGSVSAGGVGAGAGVSVVTPSVPSRPNGQGNRPNRPFGFITEAIEGIQSIFPGNRPPNGQGQDVNNDNNNNRPFGFITEAIQSVIPGFNPNPGAQNPESGIQTEGGGGYRPGGGGFGFGNKGGGGKPVFNYKPLIIGQTVNHGGAGIESINGGGGGRPGLFGRKGNKGNKGRRPGTEAATEGSGSNGGKKTLAEKFEEKKKKKKKRPSGEEEDDDDHHRTRTRYSDHIRPGIGVNLLLKPKYVPLDSHQGIDLLPQVGFGVEYGKGRFKYQPRAHLNVFPAGFFGPYPSHVSKPPLPPPPPPPLPPIPAGGPLPLPYPGSPIPYDATLHHHIHNYLAGGAVPNGVPFPAPLGLEAQGISANSAEQGNGQQTLSSANIQNLISSAFSKPGTLQQLPNPSQQYLNANVPETQQTLSLANLIALQQAGLLSSGSVSQQQTPAVPQTLAPSLELSQ